MKPSRPWLRNRFGVTAFFLIPFGWQGGFVPGYQIPTGIPLPGDPEMSRATTDLGRLIPTWKHQAVVRLPKRMTGYICYKFEGQEWRIRVRDLVMEEYHAFKVNLSQQDTRLAFVNEFGEEILLEVVEEYAPINDPRYAHLPTY